MSNMEKLENELNFALVTLNSFAVRGPLIIPVGKAMESVSCALGVVQEIKQDIERAAEMLDDNDAKEERENCGAPGEAQRSGFVGERTSNGVERMPGERRVEQKGVCEDDAAAQHEVQ